LVISECILIIIISVSTLILQWSFPPTYILHEFHLSASKLHEQPIYLFISNYIS
jgi:hypothetical protein